MQINRLSIKNIHGVRALDITPSASVILVTGTNGAGKTTTIDALRMALLGTVDRVGLKKHYSQIVTTGERIGFSLIETDTGRASLTLPNGAHDLENLEIPAALPYVLDMHAFSSMDATARREALFGILGISQSPEAIAARLTGEMGCDADKVASIAPMLASGFEAAHKHAKAQTSEARGAWKAITGEAWGSQKAEGWTAPAVEPVGDGDLDAAREAARTATDAAGEAMRAQGAIEAEARQYAQAAAKLESLRSQAERIGRIRDKLERDKAEYAVWSDKLAALPPEPGAADLRPPMACPDCGSMLVLHHGRLEHHQPGGTEDPEIAVKRTEQQKAVKLYAHAVETGQRDLLAAERAKVELDALGQITAIDDAAVERARAAAKVAQQASQEAAQRLRALEQQASQAAQAEVKTQQAAQHHADALAWTKLAEALSPDGLPARMVADALGPMNKLLAAHARETGWMVPRIDADMAITADGRLFGLLSESEQWRIDAMLTVAIAQLSGIRMCALDRFDVLHPDDRPDALFWLDGLAADGAIEQVWLAGTLKAKPGALPEHCEAVWIERARDEVLKEAA